MIRVSTVLVLACVAVLAGLPATAQSPALPEGVPLRDGAWPVTAEKFNFIVLGDRTGGTPREWPVFDRAVEEINTLRPDFVMMVGDLIEGYSTDMEAVEAEWAEFWEHAGKVEAPFLFLPGNHDISNPEMLAWWKEHIGQTYYSFVYKGCHFLALNTQEHWVENSSTFGPDQVRFAVDALEAQGDALHTFVFLHVPLWHHDHAEWAEIEAALGSRPYTVIAGHYHRLSHELRNDRRYIVVSATKGEAVDRPNDLPEFGGFPHYTKVTVDGPEPVFSLIEPGNIWPVDVAPRETQTAFAGLIRVTAAMPEGLDGPQAVTRVLTSLKNDLPEPVTVRIEFVGTGEGSWQPVDGAASRTVDLAAGARQEVESRFEVAAGRLVPVPRLRYSIEYKGKRLPGSERNAPVFPEEALRVVPEWTAVGPFPAGDLPRALPDNPREAMPVMFRDFGPESGFDPEAQFESNGSVRQWQVLRAQPEVGDGFLNLLPLAEDTPINVIGYAVCGIRSPRDQTVYAQFRDDDYGIVFVNGEAIEGGRVYRTRRDPTVVTLPLREGWNEVMVKIASMTGGWSFGLLVVDPEGELEFSPRPEP